MSGIMRRFRRLINRIGNFFRRRNRTVQRNPDGITLNFDGEYIGFDRFDSEIDYISSDYNNGSPEDFGLVGTSANIPLAPEVEESSYGESRTESSSTIELTTPETSELPIKDSEDNHPFVDAETLHTAEKKVKVKRQDPNTVIVVNGHEFDIHRNLFSEASTYFKEAFAGAENKQLVLHIHSEVVTSSVFEAILTFIYDEIVEIPSKEFLNLFLSSRILGIPRLNQHCLQLLDPSTNDIKHLLNFYEVVCQLKKKRSTVLKILAHHFETLIIQDDFLAFTAEQVVELFTQDEIGARSEVVVFAAALEWINHKYLEREEHIVKIFRCIRFTEMTMQEVVACFHPTILPGVVEMAEIKAMLLNATCYLCAKSVHQEHLFNHLKSQPRTLLLKDEFLGLWDTDIFDPNYTKNVAATKIQAAFRGYRTRKQLLNNDDPKIRKWYSDYSMTRCNESEFRIESEIREEIVGQTTRFDYPKSEVKNYRYFLKRIYEKRRVFPEDLE